MPWKTDFYEMLSLSLKVQDQDRSSLLSEHPHTSASAYTQLSFNTQITFTCSNFHSYKLSYGDCPLSSFQHAMILSEMFRFLQVISSLLMALALGSNDVANAISPLIILM